MNKIGKNTIIILLGFCGGLAAWPVLELVLWNQGVFGSFLMFLIVATVIPGLFTGLFLGSAEGLLSRSSGRAVKGALIGLVAGSIGGMIGGFAGQFLLSTVARLYPAFGVVQLTVVRTLAWTLVGIFVGISEGIRALSARKAGLGALGGMIGGALGGVIFELLSTVFSSSMPRLLGLVIMGTMIGVFYTLFDKKFSFGVLRVLNGEQAGKRYRINQKKMDLGSGNRTIIFSEYDGVEDKEIELQVNKGVITIIDEKSDKTLLVNDKTTAKTELKYGDVIKAGSVKLMLEAE